MHCILDQIIGALRNAGIREVYPSFDAVPVSKKSNSLFTVIGLESLQLDVPYPDGKGGVHPFNATLKVSVLVPMSSPLSAAESFFYDAILPLLQQVGAVPGEAAPPVVDVKLQKIVKSAKFRLRGLYLDYEEIPPDSDSSSANSATEVSE